jgi:hypothetical protein
VWDVPWIPSSTPEKHKAHDEIVLEPERKKEEDPFGIVNGTKEEMLVGNKYPFQWVAHVVGIVGYKKMRLKEE